jgi:hypothetical protein
MDALDTEKRMGPNKAEKGIKGADQAIFIEDESLLKLAESAFGFWDNAEDSIYDNL